MNKATMTRDEMDALGRLVEQRAAMYGFLSRLYRVEVDAETLKSLREGAYPASTGDESLDEGYRLLASYLGRAGEDEAVLTELAVDYVRVFFGHGVDAHSAAYPFESVHVSARRLLMQEARDEVLLAYRSFGIEKQSSWKEGEDHIALELEFMQILSLRAAEAVKAGDAERAEALLTGQRNFLEDHLAAWVPLLAREMEEFSRTDFYRALARLTKGFVDVDAEFLRDVADLGRAACDGE